jgi:hypothetical protein
MTFHDKAPAGEKNELAKNIWVYYAPQRMKREPDIASEF